ncbi:MAG: lamin tail domain-containing protein [bacterium]|nr:lamin tail domain-containing protein [bacterium]
MNGLHRYLTGVFFTVGVASLALAGDARADWNVTFTADGGTLGFAGGEPFGTAWITLDEGWRTRGVAPRGTALTRVELDQNGRFELPFRAQALVGGTRLAVIAVPEDGDWSRAVQPPTLTPPLASGGPSVLTQQTGELVITEFLKDPTQVSDASGEWIEVFNASGLALDIEGWVLSDEGSDRFVLTNQGQGIFILPGQYFVLGREVDPGLNGGVPVDFPYAGMTLSNGADEIVLTRPDGRVVDRVRYDGVVWPDEAGRAIYLAPLATNAHRGDDGTAWCAADTPLVPGGADMGSPGQANPMCL